MGSWDSVTRGARPRPVMLIGVRSKRVWISSLLAMEEAGGCVEGMGE